MKLGLRWSAKMRPETRKIAEEAAHRSGLSLNDWLESVVAHQAGQPRVSSPPLSDDAFHGGDFETVNYRLDRLSQRIDQMSGSGPAAYAPKRTRTREDSASSSHAAPNLPMPPNLERALAEIAARQRALGSPAPAAPPQTAAAPPLQAQHLAGLEEQLRNLNSQIEILRKPGVEEAIRALREELGQIGKTLRDAMPRRELEAIERQIQALDRRIAESRQTGMDTDALVGIEHGLAEIRDAVRGLMPAEALAGYTEAVANLAHKIEAIVAQNDPATIAQLEQAVTTLREISGHIASNDTVRGLAGQIHQLGDKIDAMAQIGGGEAAFGHLEQRIAMLSDALTERTQDGGPMSPRLEALLAQISEKIDSLHGSQGGGAAFGHLEDHMVRLVEKLDASDARLGHLEGIERGLADLLIHFEKMRSGTQAANADEEPAVADLQLKIARTQDTLEAVHGTLGHVVERLATIEKDIRVQPGDVPATMAGATQAPAFVDDAPSITAAVTPQDETIAPPTQRRLPASARLPADADLPENQPLEPGSGRPPVNPAARIAASEAALGDTVATTTPAGKSSFIAAARRAAQAASQQPGVRAQRSGTAAEAKPASLRDKIMKRAKSVIIAASIIAIVVGSVQIAGNVFKWNNPFLKLGEATLPAAKTTIPAPSASNDQTAQDAEPLITGSIEAKPDHVGSPLAIAPLAPPPMGDNVLATGPAPVNPLTPVSPSLFGPPILPPRDDVTGSIPPITTIPAINPAASPALSVPPLGERLPLAIGGPRLRSAALAGDAAAAYAVAERYADGKGVPVNMEEAAQWFERAAGKGLVPAQFRYASLLEKGLGVKKDLAQARRLYLAAATKGNAKAMHNLAVLYAEGADGKSDYTTAVQWFRKAAQHGVADSQYNLGVLCARGLGTEQNYAEAYKWFALAAAEGDGEAAKKRDEVAGRLDPAALAAAEKSVQTFVAIPQPPEAVTVREPQGGWDHAANEPIHGKPRTAPLALSAFQTGKR